MKLQTLRQNDFATLDHPYDLVVGAFGYESRARFVATELSKKTGTSSNKYVFAFKEHPDDCARLENDRVFQDLGYKPLRCSGGSASEVRDCFEKALVPLEH